MKANKVERPRRVVVLMTLAAILLLAAIGGIWYGYMRLRGVCNDQSKVVDFQRQVRIFPSKMVRSDVIAEAFGLREGVNLAEIDFAEKRKQFLESQPILKSVVVERILPDAVSISVEERSPIARVANSKGRDGSSRVVDTEGVVFRCSRNTTILPVIRETAASKSIPGSRLAGMKMAALRLVEISRGAEFLNLKVAEVDTTRQDYLLVTLANYSRVKIAWEGMKEDTPASRAQLSTQLHNLMDAMRSRICTSTMIWNVTLPGRVFADTQERL